MVYFPFDGAKRIMSGVYRLRHKRYYMDPKTGSPLYGITPEGNSLLKLLNEMIVESKMFAYDSNNRSVYFRLSRLSDFKHIEDVHLLYCVYNGVSYDNHVHEHTDPTCNDPVILCKENGVPYIVGAINFIQRIEVPRISKKEGRHVTMNLEEEFRQILHAAYRESEINCGVSPEALHLLKDPESLTASGDVCRIKDMKPAEVEEEFAKLIAKPQQPLS